MIKKLIIRNIKLFLSKIINWRIYKMKNIIQLNKNKKTNFKINQFKAFHLKARMKSNLLKI